jgi:hypothetical protein
MFIFIYSQSALFVNLLHSVLTKCGTKSKNFFKIKRNFKTEIFKFPHVLFNSVDAESSQSVPHYSHLYLNHCTICWVFPCPHL